MRPPHHRHLRAGEPLTPTLQERASLLSIPRSAARKHAAAAARAKPWKPIHLSKVSVEFRKLRRNLWFAGCRHRADDVDVDVGDHRAVRRRTEFGNRTPDRAGYNRRPPKAAWCPRRRHGRHAGTGGSSSAQTTLACRINIDAKVGALGEAQQSGAIAFAFLASPTGPGDLRALRAT